jgi:hypothetical protein
MSIPGVSLGCGASVRSVVPTLFQFRYLIAFGIVALLTAAEPREAATHPMRPLARPQVYVDESGDAPIAPDIVSVVVTNDDAGLLTLIATSGRADRWEWITRSLRQLQPRNSAFGAVRPGAAPVTSRYPERPVFPSRIIPSSSRRPSISWVRSWRCSDRNFDS